MVMTTLPSMPTITTVSTAKVVMATPLATTQAQMPYQPHVVTSPPVSMTSSPWRTAAHPGEEPAAITIQQQSFVTPMVSTTAIYV